MTKWDLGFYIRPVFLPAFSRQFITVAIIPIFHDVVDPHSTIAIVIVVGLPEGAVGVDADLPVVPAVGLGLGAGSGEVEQRSVLQAAEVGALEGGQRLGSDETEERELGTGRTRFHVRPE